MTTAARWEEKFHEQITANNLLSDKLRKTREVGLKVINQLKSAYGEAMKEVMDLKYTIQLLEAALIKEIPDAEFK